MDRDGLVLRKTSSTPAVVPGAAPALAKAGVGGSLQLLLLLSTIILIIAIVTIIQLLSLLATHGHVTRLCMAKPRLRLRWRLEEVSNEMPYKKDNGDSVPGFHRAEFLKPGVMTR